MLKCSEKSKLLLLFTFVVLGACMLHSGAKKPAGGAKSVMPAKEQEEYKASIMACNFVKKHEGITVGPESVCHFKITGEETYTVKGVVAGNDKIRNWSVTLRFNGSDWNNINNWAELAFCINCFNSENG
jgi:hypothetical protein